MRDRIPPSAQAERVSGKRRTIGAAAAFGTVSLGFIPLQAPAFRDVVSVTQGRTSISASVTPSRTT